MNDDWEVYRKPKPPRSQPLAGKWVSFGTNATIRINREHAEALGIDRKVGGYVRIAWSRERRLASFVLTDKEDPYGHRVRPGSWPAMSATRFMKAAEIATPARVRAFLLDGVYVFRLPTEATDSKASKATEEETRE